MLGFTIPSTWYQAFNPFAIALLVPVLNAFWSWQARRGAEPSSLRKMAIGCLLLGGGFVVMIAGADGMAPGVQRSVLWLVGSTVVLTLGELYLSPIGLSFVTKVSPVRIVSMMMGVWYLSSFVGNPQGLAQAIRRHWSIENSLHWVLDVTFREDDSRVRDPTAVRNFALLRKIAINLVSQDRSTKASMRAKRKKAAWDDDYMLQLLKVSFMR